MEISITEFLVQLGPEFLKYKSIFIENVFKDSSSLRAMDVEFDLDMMFVNPPLPLGHKRKIQMAVRNLNTATLCKVPENESTNDPIVQEQDSTSMSKIQTNILNNIISKERKKTDLENKRRSLDVVISDPEPVGPSKSVRCGNCHLRGHKADGNRGNKQCSLPPCTEWKDCGQKDRHPEYKRDIKLLERELKTIDKEIEEMKSEEERVASYKEKSNNQFIAIVKERLRATNVKKYINTNVLMRDVIFLKEFYKNEVPAHSQSRDMEEFSSILEDRQRKSLARYNVPKSLSKYEDISDDEPPSKKFVGQIQANQNKKPSHTATSGSMPQVPDWTNRNMYGMNSELYGFNPYYPWYYQQLSYQNMYSAQPPLPQDPPPTNPPLPDSN